MLSRRIPLSGVLLGLVAVLSVAGLAFALWAPLLNDRLSMKGRIADKNVAAREALWTGAVRMAADRPLIGVGPGRFGTESPRYVRNNPIPLGETPVVHNSYLHVLAEIGLLGLHRLRRLPRLLVAPARSREKASRSASETAPGAVSRPRCRHR